MLGSRCAEHTLSKRPFFIHPLGLAFEARSASKLSDVIALEFVAAFGPDCFPAFEPHHEVFAYADGLTCGRSQMHFDAMCSRVVSCFMPEFRQIEVAA